MVSKIEKVLKTPCIFASILCALFCYGNFIPLRKNSPYQSAVKKECLTGISGSFCSNPTKTGNGKFYKVQVNPKMVSGSLGETIVSASAVGNVCAFFPSEIVEACYPGKLHSIAKSTMLVERGELFTPRGYWSKALDAFVVSSADYCGYDESFLGKIKHFRALQRLCFKRLMYAWNDAGGLILALLSGSREYTNKKVSDAFRIAGLSHILALSGMHLSFFSGIASFGEKKLFGKKVELPFQFVAVILFVWFAGLSPSLTRAFLCTFLLFLGELVFYKTLSLVPILSLSFLIHISLFPNDIKSAAFLLSYSSLLGILLFSSSFLSIFSAYFPPVIAQSLSASVGAQIATMPISLYLFKAISPIGIVATLIVSPLVSVFMALAAFAIPVSLVFPLTSAFFGTLLKILYQIIAFCVSIFAKVPPLSFC